MIKQVDEILDNLKNRITKEPFGEEDIGPLVDNYVKMANIQIRTLEIKQKNDAEILKILEKDLMYYKGLENEFMILNNQSEARKENKLIINYLESFFRRINNGIYWSRRICTN